MHILFFFNFEVWPPKYSPNYATAYMAIEWSGMRKTHIKNGKISEKYNKNCEIERKFQIYESV